MATAEYTAYVKGDPAGNKLGDVSYETVAEALSCSMQPCFAANQHLRSSITVSNGH